MSLLLILLIEPGQDVRCQLSRVTPDRISDVFESPPTASDRKSNGYPRESLLGNSLVHQVRSQGS